MSTKAKVVDRIREFSDNVISPAAAEHDRAGDWPGASIKALADAGLLGLTVPEKLGGMGQGPSSFVAVVEELAAACASTSMIFVMHVCATETIKQSSLPQRDSVLSDISAGRHLSTLAFSEIGSRSHFWAPVNQETEQNGSHLLNCQKYYVPSAGHANSYVVSTRAVGATGMTESSLYYIEKDAPGFSVAGPWNGLGVRANASAPM